MLIVYLCVLRLAPELWKLRVTSVAGFRGMSSCSSEADSRLALPPRTPRMSRSSSLPGSLKQPFAIPLSTA